MRSFTESSSASVSADYDGTSISDHSRLLANQLSSHMGLTAAIQVSIENQWHGVVAALLQMQRARAARD